VKTVKVPRKTVGRSAASVPVLLLLGTLSGTALAATDIGEPCPEAQREAVTLHEIIVRDAASAIAQTIEATETISGRPLVDVAEEGSVDDTEEAADETEATEYSTPEFTSRLPGISVNDLPGFRRHMFRTDI
jgi:hypothetical protein